MARKLHVLSAANRLQIVYIIWKCRKSVRVDLLLRAMQRVRVKRSFCGASLVIKKGMCLSEPTILHHRLMVARASLLSLQEVVAKHNEGIRSRYPHSDSLYKSFERAMMGVFNDMPIQVHAFSHAAENVAFDCKEVANAADVFTEGMIDILDRARSWAGAPKRNNKGAIQWKRSVSHVEVQLASEIGQRANAFFKAVYALPGVHAKELRSEEKAFWARYAKLMAAHGRAKKDAEAKKEVRIVLAKSLPDTICWHIAAYVQ